MRRATSNYAEATLTTQVDQLKLEEDTFASTFMSSPWSAEASLHVGEPLRFGLASREQRWGIVGASFGVALGDLR